MFFQIARTYPMDMTTETPGAFDIVSPAGGVWQGSAGDAATFENAPQTDSICVTKVHNGLPGPFIFTIQGNA